MDEADEVGEIGLPNQGCTLPPEGWWCSREPGHDGPCAARPVAVEIEDLRAAVTDALQSAWDDFVGDTGCFPDCFSLLNARSNTQMTADFGKGNFAWMVADWLLPDIETALTASSETVAPPGSITRP